MSTAYFDVKWQGPVLNASHKPTGDVKGKVSSTVFRQ